MLPEDLIPDGSGNPLNKCAAFLNVRLPGVRRAGAARDRHDGHLRRQRRGTSCATATRSNDEAMVGAGTQYWMPMDQYIGGIEHAILHLLYARFWTKVMRDLRLVSIDEPFTQLLTQGMVLKEAFVRDSDEAGQRVLLGARPGHRARRACQKVVSATAQGATACRCTYEGWTTMSKSKNNGVDPQELIERYGADTARLFVMFAAPPEQTMEWNDAGVEGAHRFLKRVWNFGQRHAADCAAPADCRRGALERRPSALRCEVHTRAAPGELRLRAHAVQHRRLRRDEDAQRARGLQGRRAGARCARAMRMLLRVLYPACPHITWVLWRELGFAAEHGDLLDAPWPQVDEAALVQDADRTGAAGQRQDARRRARGGRRPSAPRSRPRRWPAPTSPSSPKAARRRRSSSCPGGW